MRRLHNPRASHPAMGQKGRSSPGAGLPRLDPPSGAARLIIGTAVLTLRARCAPPGSCCFHHCPQRFFPAVTTSSSLRRLGSELLADASSPQVLPALTTGLASGLGLLVAQIAFGSFIFSGPLASWSSQGIGLVLFGNFAASLIVGLGSSFRGAIAGLSPALVPVMTMVGFSMAAEGETLFVTTAVALMLSAVATGLCFALIGWFRLANLVRFIPWPVAGGFVAGIGGVVCRSAMAQMGVDMRWQALPALVEPSMLWIWVPGAAFGIGLYMGVKRWGNPLITPVSIVCFVATYHVALAAIGISSREAQAKGLLLRSTIDGNLWPVLQPTDLLNVDVAAMATQLPILLTLVLVALIVVVMNVAGLEMVANQEMDWNREFKAGGLATIVAGAGGGTVASLIVPASLRSKLLGASTRITCITYALVMGGALLLGDGMLELVPIPLVGGILFFAGLGMLDEGLFRSRKQLPWSEYGIILLIFVVIVAFGLIEGVAAGMVATLVSFAVRLSRVDPIAAHFTARERRSSKARSVPDRAILLEDGDRVLAYQLRGYIFFGSVSPLADLLRQSLRGRSRPAGLILDFAATSGFDVSAVNVLARFLRSARAAGVRMVLSGVSKPLVSGLERNLPPSDFSAVRVEPSVDRALECCEDMLITVWKQNASAAEEQRTSLFDTAADDLQRHLERQVRFEALVDELRSWLHPHRYAAGETIAGLGLQNDGLQLLISGRASSHEASGTRSRQYSPGDAIWPVNPSGQTTPSVIADEPCTTMVLTSTARLWLESHEEQRALHLYQHLLAGRFEGAPETG